MLPTTAPRLLMRRRSPLWRSLYSWGTGDNGQLGHPVTKSGLMNSYVESTPRPVHSLEGVDLVDAASSSLHSAVVTTDGRVFTCGKAADKNGHHALGHSAADAADAHCAEFAEVEGLAGVGVAAVSCGEHHTAVLSDEGDLYTWGVGGSFWGGAGVLGRAGVEYSPRPERVVVGDEESLKLQAIASGKSHMLGLGVDGEVWSWGKGDSGRLGNGENEDQPVPEPVEFLLDIDAVVTAVACGDGYSVALTDQGEVYAWGKNEQLQLGLGGGLTMEQYSMEHLPRLVEGLSNEKIVRIACGSAHTVAINQAGELFLWGQRTWMEPHKMTALNGRNVVDVAAGHNFTACLSDVGEVIVWAKGMVASRALGGNVGTQPEAAIGGIESICKLSCGKKHVLALPGLPKLMS